MSSVPVAVKTSCFLGDELSCRNCPCGSLEYVVYCEMYNHVNNVKYVHTSERHSSQVVRTCLGVLNPLRTPLPGNSVWRTRYHYEL